MIASADVVAAVVMAAGAVAVAVAWRLVARGWSIWRLMTGVLVVAASASLATGEVHLSPSVRTWVAAIVGIVVGLALYAATAVFVRAARRIAVFERGMRDVYDQRHGLSLPAALVLAAVVVAPCEEIFWRGLFQTRLSVAAGAAAGAAITLAVYAAANAASASLPITTGAVVSGAVWGTLAWWTGGVLSPMLCHAMWTGLMIAFPPGGDPLAAARDLMPGEAAASARPVPGESALP